MPRLVEFVQCFSKKRWKCEKFTTTTFMPTMTTTTMDKFWSEKFTWAFSPGELKNWDLDLKWDRLSFIVPRPDHHCDVPLEVCSEQYWNSRQRRIPLYYSSFPFTNSLVLLSLERSLNIVFTWLDVQILNDTFQWNKRHIMCRSVTFRGVIIMDATIFFPCNIHLRDL